MNYDLSRFRENFHQAMGEDRPREKLLMKGVSLFPIRNCWQYSSDRNDKESAVELSRRILQKADNDLGKLAKFTVSDLINNFRGIGMAKAVAIVAAMELGKRRKESGVAERKKILSSRDAYAVFSSVFIDLNHEETWVLLLDRANQVVDNMQVVAAA